MLCLCIFMYAASEVPSGHAEYALQAPNNMAFESSALMAEERRSMQPIGTERMNKRPRTVPNPASMPNPAGYQFLPSAAGLPPSWPSGAQGNYH